MPVDIPTAVMDKLLGSSKQRSGMSLRQRIFVLCLIWTVSLFSFVMLSRTTWFGRPLSDQQIGEYLHADEKPNQIEYALGQIRQRMSRRDTSVSIWYPDLVRLSSHSLEEVRATDAVVMGENGEIPELHEALIAQLADSSATVRFNASTSLARSRDSSGWREIVGTLSAPDSATEQRLQALTALSYIGTERDIPLVMQYQAPRPEIPERIRQQAIATTKAIQARIAKPTK